MRYLKLLALCNSVDMNNPDFTFFRKHRMKRNENAEVEETEHFEAVT